MPLWSGHGLYFFALLIILFSKFKFLAHKPTDKICYIQNKIVMLFSFKLMFFLASCIPQEFMILLYVWE